jgi:taurine dioxygenase
MNLPTPMRSARCDARNSLTVIPAKAAPGAEVSGVDLKHLDDAAFERLIKAWHQYSVILMRGQAPSLAPLARFSCRGWSTAGPSH